MPWPFDLMGMPANGARGDCARYSVAGSTEAKRPRLPRSVNLTRPVTLAKSVSSEPMPTLTPGLMRVPRWRHDDGAAGDQLAGKGLYAQPLCV